MTCRCRGTRAARAVDLSRPVRKERDERVRERKSRSKREGERRVVYMCISVGLGFRAFSQVKWCSSVYGERGGGGFRKHCWYYCDVTRRMLSYCY